MTDRKFYCVMCGAIKTDANGLDTCPKSELDLAHLWATVGHIESWFPVKRVYGPDGAVRSA